MKNTERKDREIDWQVKMRNSIRTRFLFAFVALFTLVFVLAGWASMSGLPFSSFNGWVDSAAKRAEGQLSMLADLHKERLKNWFSERSGDLEVIAHNQVLTKNLPPLVTFVHGLGAAEEVDTSGWTQLKQRSEFTDISAFLSSVQSAYGQNQAVKYKVLRVVDIETSRILVSTNNIEVGSIADFDMHFPIDNHREGEAGYTGVTFSNASPHFDITHAVMNDEDTIIAAVVIEITTGELLEPFLATRSGLGETGEALLVDENVRILTELRHPLRDGSTARVLEHVITDEPAVLAAEGQEGIIESEDYRGQEVIAAYRYLSISPSFGLGMVVKIDKQQLYAPANTALMYSVIIAVGGLLLMIILTLLMTSQLTRPIRRMAKIAGRFAGGDRSARIRFESNDEIGLLSSALDEMAEKIETTWQQLDRRSADLDNANKELESFAYSVAHDLRAPLRTVDGFSQALVEDYSESLDDEALKYLGYLREGSQEMGMLIDDLLALSRATRGEVKVENVNLSVYAANILESLLKAEPERVVRVDIAPNIVVKGDPRLLHVLMENLLGNAWKFTAKEEQGQIEFSAEQLGEKIRCQVKDNGVGFDMAYQNKLFEPFRRLHSSEEFDGSGIGLATVKRIINRHHGNIQAKGSIGAGANFIFELDSGAVSHE